MKKYSYILRLIVLGSLGFVLKIYIEQLRTEIEELNKKAVAKNKLYTISSKWLSNSVNRIDISKSLLAHGYLHIGIYGMGILGRTLYDELLNTNVDVVYGIDRNGRGIYTDIPIYGVDEETIQLDPVDVIVVTTVDCFEQVEQLLKKKVDCPIISLEQLI